MWLTGFFFKKGKKRTYPTNDRGRKDEVGDTTGNRIKSWTKYLK